MSKNILNAMSAIVKEQADIAKKVSRHEKILNSQGQQIAELERQVIQLRNDNICIEISQGVPAREVAAKHGLTPARVSQIKNSHRRA